MSFRMFLLVETKRKGDQDKPMKSGAGKAEFMIRTLSVRESTPLVGTTESFKTDVNRGKKNETKTASRDEVAALTVTLLRSECWHSDSQVNRWNSQRCTPHTILLKGLVELFLLLVATQNSSDRRQTSCMSGFVRTHAQEGHFGRS